MPCWVKRLDRTLSVKYLYTMPPAHRHHPARTACSDSEYSLIELMREFPDDAACLQHLWRTRHSEDAHHDHCPK